ncbi:MAG: AAA family ATPase [Pseudomonadales bacterium]
MQFQEIRLKHFQQFADEKIIRDLQPNLNVVCGSNESGKSTLVAALKAAIFERYSSRPLQDRYRPFSMQVSPEVGLRFQYDGSTYDLRKTFSNKKDGGVVLTEVSGRGKWTDHEAEERVAAMFGNEIAGRGESNPENQGIHGLLWVDQTHAHIKVAPADRAHGTLQGALDEEVLDMLGGEHGQALLQRVKSLRDEYLTETGKNKGNYRKLSDELDKLRDDCAVLSAELESYEAQVDELEVTQQRLEQYQQDATLQKVETTIARLEKEWQAIEGLKQKIDQHESTLALAQAQRDNADDKNLARQQRVAAVVDAQNALAEARDRLASVDARVKPLAEDFASAESELQQARQAAKQLAARLELKESYKNYLRLDEELTALDGQYKKGQQLQKQIDDCDSRARAISVSDKLVTKLAALETDIRVNAARLDSVATRIELDLLPKQTLEIGEQTYGGKHSVLITEPTSMQLPGLGRCVIQPGGDEIKVLQQELGELQESFAAMLAQAGVESTAAANRALNERQRLQADKNAAAKTLEALAPGGLVALETQRTERRAEHGVLHNKLAGRDAESADDIAQLVLQRERNDDTIATLEQRLRSKRSQLEEAQNERIKARVLLEGSEAASREAVDSLQHEREQISDADLQQQWRSAVSEVGVIEEALNDRAQELAAVKPEDINAELKQKQEARTAISADINELTNKAAELRGELRSLGQRGLADELADAELALAQRQREYQQLQRKVGGLDLLYRCLEEASQRAKKAVAQPIIDAMQPYLATLMPGVMPVVDENFQLTALQRAGAEEPFERLSIGTREQLAVLVRLAYADMLFAKGQPVTVLLDDALVNADDERRDRMKRILYRAARNYQVILLTCQPRHYHDAGGHMILID